jgi:hypothetical protein
MGRRQARLGPGTWLADDRHANRIYKVANCMANDNDLRLKTATLSGVFGVYATLRTIERRRIAFDLVV